jgi:DNA-binding GntR family transcriptional regulator
MVKMTNKTASDLIVESLLKAIKNKKLLPGQELTQEKLAEEFGVSRMPVRDALKTLIAEGSLTKMTNRHICVAGKKADQKAKTTNNIKKPKIIKTSKNGTDYKAITENMTRNKLQLLPAREQVAAILRKDIWSGKLQEGQLITLEEIAGMVGVSSMPVREAFQILQTEGFLELRHNKAAVVLGINKQLIKDHYELRALLESEAIGIVAEKHRNIDGINAVFEEAKKSLAEHKYAEYKAYNQSWHMAIWQAAGNTSMTRVLSNLWNGLSQGYKMTEQDYAKISITEHEQIMKALRKYDGPKCRKLMRHHIVRSMKSIMTNLK